MDLQVFREGVGWVGEKCCLAREGNQCVEGGSPLLFLLNAVTVRKSDIALLKASTDGIGFLYSLQQ